MSAAALAPLPPAALSEPTPRLGDELLSIITDAITSHPRSLQVAIGPSEVGTPCARKLGYKLLAYPERPQPPNWKATVGTAIHAWLESIFDQANLAFDTKHGNHGIERWLIEQRVTVGKLADGTPISGHVDLFDRVTGTVVDWKSVGPTQLRKYRSKGPGDQYRTQAHLYGRGYAGAGHTVNNVMIVFLARNGDLDDTVIWTEPYDERIALDALQRLSGIKLATTLTGPAALESLPTADNYCTGCPFYRARSTDVTKACPGHPKNTLEAPPALSIAG